MKFRNDFVTNSSSSSFIIAFDNTENSISSNMIKAIQRTTGSGKKIITTIEELQNYFIDDRYLDDSIPFVEAIESEGSYIVEQYNKGVRAINEGKAVCFLSISNEIDDPLGDFLTNFSELDSVLEIIDSEGY